MVRLRKILFITFTLLYVTLCPILVLYSLGIIIKPEKKRIVRTGVIYINTIPEGASVLINGKLQRDETPTVIDNLIPGTYHLEIKAPNYQPWITNVEVSANKAAPFENILLLPEPLTQLPISPWPIQQLTAVDNNPFVLAATGNNTQDFYLHLWDESFRQNILPDEPTQSSFLKPLFASNPAIPKGRILKTFSVPSSPYMIFYIDTPKGPKLYWTDLILGPTKTEDITDLFPVNPKDIQWSVSDPRHLFSLEDHAVNRIDIATRAIYPRTIGNVQAFSVFGQTMFLLTANKTLLKTTTSDPQVNIRQASLSPIFKDLVLKYSPITRLAAVSENTIFLIGKNGGLLSNLKPYLLADKGVIGFKWHRKPQKLVFWTSIRVGIFDFSKNPIPEGPQAVWIDHSFNNINRVHWINDTSHLLIEDTEELFIADADCCNFSDVRKIADIRKNSNIHYSERTGKIFFIHKRTGLLSSTEIIPQHSLLQTVNKDRTEKSTAP